MERQGIDIEGGRVHKWIMAVEVGHVSADASGQGMSGWGVGVRNHVRITRQFGDDAITALRGNRDRSTRVTGLVRHMSTFGLKRR